MKFSIRLLDGTLFDLSDFEGEFIWDNILEKYGSEVAEKIFDACEDSVMRNIGVR